MEIGTHIRIEHCSKRFNERKVLDDISFEIGVGNFITVLGQTGSGKTTLVRLIAGLEKPDSGKIFFGETLASGPDSIEMLPKDRKIGFIFQDLALWPHLTVYQNVEFGLKINGTRDLTDRVLSVLKRFEIDELKDRYTGKLSGGQQQLVALARSIALQPSVLIMDEPMASLDVKMKKSIRKIVKGLHHEGLTIIYVTHDHREAFELSDKIVLLNGGRIEEFGSPGEVRNSQKHFTKEFIELN